MAAINKVRKERGDKPVDFDYVLLCNKICGNSHYNMQMVIVVETQAEYDAWMAKQKAFFAKPAATEPAGPAAPAADSTKKETAQK